MGTCYARQPPVRRIQFRTIAHLLRASRKRRRHREILECVKNSRETTCQIFLKGTKTYRQATPLRLQQEDLNNSSFAW